MKKNVAILINVFLVVITGGGWLLLLLPYLIWTNKKKKAKDTGSKFQTVTPAPNKFQGSKFAQDGARGAIFSYASWTSGEILEVPYSLIDLETTGLDHKNHRIIEIAIRKINSDGSLIEELSTLINPERSDVGPTFIHHIKAEDVINAPTFKEIAPLILEKLSGSVVVAHHAAFEDSFLSSELRRIGLGVPSIPCLDTLWLSRKVLDLPNYKLATITSVFGIEDTDAHTALGDVRMIAQVLPMLLSKSQALRYQAVPPLFEKTGSSANLKTRVSNLSKGENGWMKNVMNKLPESSLGDLDNVSFQYLDQLSKALSDSKITGEEAKTLANLAGSAGLGASQVRALHQKFFSSVESIALEDGVLDDSEIKKLDKIKRELGL